MTDKDLIAGMWAIVVKHHKANTTPNQMLEILEFVRKNDESAERERTNVAKAALECGHPASLKLHSAETGEPLYCELCDMRSQRNDAVQMEEHYKAERDALRERVAGLEAERDSFFEESQRRQRARLLAEAEVIVLRERLRDLIEGLERTHWSSWQTTAHFWKQFEAARTALEGK